MEHYAKALTVLVLGGVAALLDLAGVDVPTDALESVVYALVGGALVWLVPNSPE